MSPRFAEWIFLLHLCRAANGFWTIPEAETTTSCLSGYLSKAGELAKVTGFSFLSVSLHDYPLIFMKAQPNEEDFFDIRQRLNTRREKRIAHIYFVHGLLSGVALVFAMIMIFWILDVEGIV